MVKQGERYRHYKGGEYEIVCVSVDEPTHKTLVTYKSLKDDRVWTRSLETFLGDVSTEIQVSRFEKINEDNPTPKYKVGDLFLEKPYVIFIGDLKIFRLVSIRKNKTGETLYNFVSLDETKWISTIESNIEESLLLFVSNPTLRLNEDFAPITNKEDKQKFTQGEILCRKEPEVKCVNTWIVDGVCDKKYGDYKICTFPHGFIKYVTEKTLESDYVSITKQWDNNENPVLETGTWICRKNLKTNEENIFMVAAYSKQTTGTLVVSESYGIIGLNARSENEMLTISRFTLDRDFAVLSRGTPIKAKTGLPCCDIQFEKAIPVEVEPTIKIATFKARHPRFNKGDRFCRKTPIVGGVNIIEIMGNADNFEYFAKPLDKKLVGYYPQKVKENYLNSQFFKLN